MGPALAKLETSRCDNLLVSDLIQTNSVSNQPDQYSKFVKGMLLEEVISVSLMHPAYYVNQNLPSRFGQRNTAL